MTLLERIKAPTPKFFKAIRNIGMALVAAGGVIVAAPIALPVIVVSIGGYLIVAGTVAIAVAQSVTCEEEVYD